MPVYDLFRVITQHWPGGEMNLQPLSYKPNAQQMVKVIWHKATSPPHTDSSIVFARLCQCVPHLVHPSQHPYHTGAAPCWAALSISNIRHVQVCPAASPSKLPLHARGSGPPANTWFPGSTRVYVLNGIWISSATSVRLTVITDRQTKQQTTLLRL